MHLTLETLANVRGISAEEAAEATFANAMQLYGLEL
jgi:Tat protein secretion system quality control protein TatD with DNase activity